MLSMPRVIIGVAEVLDPFGLNVRFGTQCSTRTHATNSTSQ